MTTLFQRLARAGAAAFMLAGACVAHAGGTASGTPIPNSATLNYTVGGTLQAPICSGQAANNTSTCSATTFTVDTKVDVLVTSQDTTAPVDSTPGGQATLTFTVKNQGNAPQDIALSALTTIASASTITVNSSSYTDSFDPTACTLRDSAAPSTIITSYTSVGIDLTKTVLAVCTFPTLKGGTTAFTTTDVAIVALKATLTVSGSGAALVQSSTNTQGGAADILFADAAGTDDNARDAAHSARGAYKMKPALLSVAKTIATLCDPVTGDTSSGNVPMNILKAIVRYTITLANGAGGSTSILTTFADPLNAAIVFDQNFVTGANTASPASTTCSSATGTATSAATLGVRYKVTGSTRAANNTFLFGSSPAILSGSTLNFDAAWATVLPVEAGPGYALGELKPGETLTIEFNATIQ